MLDKAYKTIEEEQSFIFGRDAKVTPPVQVYETVPTEIKPLKPESPRMGYPLVRVARNSVCLAMLIALLPSSLVASPASLWS